MSCPDGDGDGAAVAHSENCTVLAGLRDGTSLSASSIFAWVCLVVVSHKLCGRAQYTYALRNSYTAGFIPKSTSPQACLEDTRTRRVLHI